MRAFSTSCLGNLAVVLAFLQTSIASETATFSPWFTANFAFTWTPPGVNVSVPTTAQCDTINITWTPLNNGSPDPIPPYYLHIYTSTLTYPLIVDAGTFSPFEWVVSFPPDTQYQICMFDSKGRTGGCQDAYTVIPPRNSSRTCNTTFPVPNTLIVQGELETGPLTQYSWPDQCTTMSLMAQNGTPPFTMTVAPSFHPPLNLTFDDMGPMNWTVTLGWGIQFWISLVDSLGASWAFGPLHSGGNGPTDCLHLAGNSLVIQPSTPKSNDVSPGAAVGIAIGALVFGIISTFALQWLLARCRNPNATDDSEQERKPVMRANSSVSTPGVDPYPIETMRAQQQVEARSTEGENPVMQERNDSQVYVVHHDAGGAPITIFTGGREVQELPPHYVRTSPEPRLTHTPSTSMDSSGGPSSGARRPKTSSTMRSLSN